MREILVRGALLDKAHRVEGRLQRPWGVVDEPLLVSADLLRRVRPGPDLQVEALGQAALRGRAAAVDIFAVKRALGVGL